jgi:hypothetical protein
MNIESGLDYFNVVFATKYGIKEAIIFQYLCHELKDDERWKRTNNRQFFDNKYWFSITQDELLEKFSYMKNRIAIRTILQNLKEQGLIETANFNKTKYDKTSWYSLTEKGEAVYEELF